ncbi:MAG TPA: glycosyltransferase [Gemmatimonadaceae bacterium]|nr:glycosyltransferase [Gemmatimonadaceae bacterium]
MRVVDVELSAPRPPAHDAPAGDARETVRALVRLHGVPLGALELPASDVAQPARLAHVAATRLGHTLLRHLLGDVLAGPSPAAALGPATAAGLAAAAHPRFAGPWPLVTVAVCTRERPHDLARCLGALERLDYPALELLVVDNAPVTDATRRVVEARGARVRYACEPRPGLSHARNLAIATARGTLLAFTDDDVVADAGWLRAAVPLFAAQPDVQAVTGLVVPLELETEAQRLFERYRGFGHGYERRWYRGRPGRVAAEHGNTGKFGAGANMIFRRDVFARIGGFDPMLGAGTSTAGGDDLEMFFRVLAEGHTLAYEPAAMVRHAHRRTHAELREQITGWGSGRAAYVRRARAAYPRERLGFARREAWWLATWIGARLARTLVAPGGAPRALILAELRGSLRSGLPGGGAPGGDAAAAPSVPDSHRAVANVPTSRSMAEYRTELENALAPLDGAERHAHLRVTVTMGGRRVGAVRIANEGAPVGPTRLADAIVAGLGDRLLAGAAEGRADELARAVLARLGAGATAAAHGGIATAATWGAHV